MDNLKQKIILVTGGGRGLGKAVCHDLAKHGATLIVADLYQKYADEVAEQLKQYGGKVVPLAMDVGSERDTAETIRHAKDLFGRLDVLINNAATDMTVSIEDLAISDWDRVISTNLRGPFLMSKLAFPVMREQKQGHIINIASTASKRTWANAAAYHASKWGLLGFSHALHVEGRPHNIKVTALVAGGMRTPFLMERFPDLDLNNLQDPANVAQTIRFLLQMPAESVIPEMMVIPMRETSWP